MAAVPKFHREPAQTVAPFADAAHELREYRLCPIPVGGEGGKKPLVKWRNQQHLPSVGYIDALIGRYPDANVGILCGPSEVTVIDIDDPGVHSDPQRLQSYLRRFGDTSLIIHTPSGGVHLYYRSAGERNANLRRHGLPVDVRSIGGMVVVPPSVKRSSAGRPHLGLPVRSYGFLVGSWMDLHRLPCLKLGSLSFDLVDPPGQRQVDAGGVDRLHQPVGRVTDGNRNDDLFHFLLRQVRQCDDFDTLLDLARTRNAEFDPPMAEWEVEKTARSAFNYEHNPQKENWVGGPPRIVLTDGQDGELPVLLQNPNGLTMYCFLLAKHGARKEPFAVSTKAMLTANSIPSFKSHRRYLDALRWLVDQGLLIPVHKGGRGTGDPSLFRFPSKKGVISTPNITNTPPLPCGFGDDKQ